MTDTKICTRCKTAKPLGAFGLDRSRPDGLQSWCRKCRQEDHRRRVEEWEAKVPAHKRRRTLNSPPVDVASKPAWERRIVRAFLSDLLRMAECCPQVDAGRFVVAWRDVRGSWKDWRAAG